MQQVNPRTFIGSEHLILTYFSDYYFLTFVVLVKVIVKVAVAVTLFGRCTGECFELK